MSKAIVDVLSEEERACLEHDRQALLHDLATGRYLSERAPVLIVGQVGVGKSHLAQALGHCAIRHGIDVLFTPCAQLTASLNAARAAGCLRAQARLPGARYVIDHR